MAEEEKKVLVDESDEDDDPKGNKKNKRGVLPKHATQVMKSWLFQHIVVRFTFFFVQTPNRKFYMPGYFTGNLLVQFLL